MASLIAAFALVSGRAVAEETLPPPTLAAEGGIPVPHPELHEESLVESELSKSFVPACFKNDGGTSPLALKDMKNSGIVGAALYNFSVSRGVTYCSVKYFISGKGGDYDPYKNSVNIHSLRGATFKLAAVINGTMRAVEKENGTLALDTRQDFRQWLRQSLYADAAAQVAEIAVAFELRQSGKPALWDMLSQPQGAGEWNLKPVLAQFEKEYGLAISEKKTISMATMQASSRAWELMFNVQSWVDFHASQTLAGYIKALDSGKFDGQKAAAFDKIPVERQIAMSDSMAGKFDRNLNLTRFARAPKDDLLLFGSNDRLLLAAEAVEVARYTKTNGPDAPETIRIKMAAEEKKNPYLGVDLSDIALRWMASSGRAGGMESAMDRAAAEKNDGKTPVMPFQPPEPKIKGF